MNRQLTISLLNDTFIDIQPKLKGIYFGRIKQEMEELFHLAYWMHNDHKINAEEIERMIFQLAPFKLGETTVEDLRLLIETAKNI